MENCSSQRFDTCAVAKTPKTVSSIQPPATIRRWRMISRARRASGPPRAAMTL
jgi:hypothetical protein